MHTDADPKKAVFIEKDVRHFPRYEHIQILWYGSTLTNNCCKTGLPERTLLKCRFVNAWLCMCHVWWEEFYWCCMYAKTASNKSKIFKKTACVLKPLRNWSTCKCNEIKACLLFFVDRNLCAYSSLHR